MDLHCNLFYSYRGPDTRSVDRDRQLENNLTKALINTLDLGGKSVWRPFLDALGLAKTSRAKFLLQRRNLPSRAAASKRDRILLGISKQPSDWSPSRRREIRYESLPDAWVYGDTFAVLVESKVGDSDFSPSQMESHRARLWQNSGKAPKVVKKTWQEIHCLFCDILTSLTDGSSTDLLVRQFIQFLEYSGMTGFNGFRPDHFDYFTLHDDDDARRWVVDQVHGLADRVKIGLRKVSSFYEAAHVGQLPLWRSDCWCGFGPEKGAFKQVTHQTMFLRSDGIAVAVNTERKPAAKRLKKLLRDPESALLFRRALKEQHNLEPFDLLIEERVYAGRPRCFEYNRKMCLTSSMLTTKVTSDVAWTAFRETIRLLPLPYLKLQRLIPRDRLLELSKHNPSKAVDRVATSMKRNHKIVEMLNK